MGLLIECLSAISFLLVLWLAVFVVFMWLPLTIAHLFSDWWYRDE